MIFVDVGAHNGQTLDEVLKPQYVWDQVHAFEPMVHEFNYLLDNYPQSNLALYNSGLLDLTGTVTLYGDNSKMEASIHATHRDGDATITTQVYMWEASEFFRLRIPAGDPRVILKLNCEGSEVKILRNLLASGEIWKVRNVMIDFDVRKCRGHEHEEAAVLAELRDAGFTDYALCENVMQGPTHQDRIGAWLKGVL